MFLTFSIKNLERWQIIVKAMTSIKLYYLDTITFNNSLTTAKTLNFWKINI